MIKLYPVVPVPAPRQVQRDKFKPSPGVQRYRAYRDELNLLRLSIPADFHHAVFLMPMPPSWSAKEREKQMLRPHQQTPDRDNLEKALLDSAFSNDCTVWNGQTTKLWWREGAVLVSDRPLNVSDWACWYVDQSLGEGYLLATTRGKRAWNMQLFEDTICR